MTEFNPDWRLHPGVIIRELFLLKVLGNDVEHDIIKQLDEIMMGRGRITPDLAEILHKELKVSAEFFLNYQKYFESSNAWDTTLPDGRRERRGYLSEEEREHHQNQGCEVLVESDGYTTVRTKREAQ